MKRNEELTARVAKYKEKHGITFATPNGGLYRFFKIAAILSLCYWMGYNLLYLLGEGLALSDGTTVFADIAATFWPVAICTALGIAGLVLICTKAHLVGSLLLPPAAAVCAIVFLRTVRNVSYAGVDDRKYLWGVQAFFYWRHLIPALLVFLFGALMAGLEIRAILKENGIYRKVEENLYNAGAEEIPTAFGDLEK